MRYEMKFRKRFFRNPWNKDQLFFYKLPINPDGTCFSTFWKTRFKRLMSAIKIHFCEKVREVVSLRNIHFSDLDSGPNGRVDVYHREEHLYRILFGSIPYDNEPFITRFMIRINDTKGNMISLDNKLEYEELYNFVRDFVMSKYLELIRSLEPKKELK